jgi:hypothetical protein
MFMKVKGDWGHLAAISGMRVDLHFGRGEPGQFWDNMAEVAGIVMTALRDAQARGVRYVIFTHGYSTSRPFQTTARSIIRGIMRSKESTPFIIKSRCMQHESVFVAAIRKTPLDLPDPERLRKGPPASPQPRPSGGADKRGTNS